MRAKKASIDASCSARLERKAGNSSNSTVLRFGVEPPAPSNLAIQDPIAQQ